ncbi:MAG: PIN domain-containing protein [Sciscionella sp.]
MSVNSCCRSPASELDRWLYERREAALVSSALVEVEVPRAMRRSAPQALVGVPATLARLYRLEIDSTIRATAAAFDNATLRSLDAIHLATAL